jgi:hypothetical protein
MTTLAIALFAALVGFILGYGTGRPKRPPKRPRCPALHNGVRGPAGRKESVSLRCELEDGHHGPHLYTVPKGFTNVGEKIWWG